MCALGLPRSVVAVGTAGADEKTLSGRRLVALQPPIQPREIDLREVATASAEQIAAMSEVLAEPDHRDVELADRVVALRATVVRNIVGPAFDEQDRRVNQVVEI